METRVAVKGGAFLITDTAPGDVFTPEDFTEDHLMIMRTTQDFVRNEVEPHVSKLVQRDLPLNRELMLKAGALGLLGADIDEEFGGTGLDKIAATVIVAASTGADVFAVTWNCHTGIGSLLSISCGVRPPLLVVAGIGFKRPANPYDLLTPPICR